ncbi:MAG: hypothetical protein ACTH14_04935, partial [Jeotgalicoccus sp.]
FDNFNIGGGNFMSFFNLLTWNNSHMDLRFVEDDLHGNVNITNVYNDDRYVNMDRVNQKYDSKLKDAQRSISSNRIIMLVLFTLAVFLPAVLLSVVQSNLLLIGGVIVYAIIAYFLMEAINQVQINKVLHDMTNDKEIHTQP